MRAGVISSLWASEGETPIRPELERDLARILRRSMAAARTTFLDRALEAIDEYRKLERPSLEVGLSRDEKMSALAQAGREFATAVSALDDDARSLLVQKQRTVLGVVDIPSFDETAAAGKWACVTAESCGHAAAQACQRKPVEHNGATDPEYRHRVRGLHRQASIASARGPIRLCTGHVTRGGWST